MIVKQKDQQTKNALGADFKALATGDKIMCTVMRMKQDRKVPKHKHPSEQVGYLINGRFKLWINDRFIGTLEPGDSYVVKEDNYHSMEIVEDSEWVDMFSPPRREYIDD